MFFFYPGRTPRLHRLIISLFRLQPAHGAVLLAVGLRLSVRLSVRNGCCVKTAEQIQVVLWYTGFVFLTPMPTDVSIIRLCNYFPSSPPSSPSLRYSNTNRLVKLTTVGNRAFLRLRLHTFGTDYQLTSSRQTCCQLFVSC